MKESLTRVSVTWRLVLQFKMLKLGSIYLGFFLISSFAFGVTKPMKDWAIFKVSDQIYFSSDITPLYQDFWTFHCAYEDAILFKVVSLEFSKNERDMLEQIGVTDVSPYNEKSKKVFRELRKLLKLISYSSQAKVSMKESLPLEVMSLAKASNCRHRGALTAKAFDRFLRLEVFLKSRFNSRLTTEPKDKKKNDEKSIEGIEAFFKTVERQISHEDFF
jgi:hypothetical protein